MCLSRGRQIKGICLFMFYVLSNQLKMPPHRVPAIKIIFSFNIKTWHPLCRIRSELNQFLCLRQKDQDHTLEDHLFLKCLYPENQINWRAEKKKQQKHHEKWEEGISGEVSCNTSSVRTRCCRAWWGTSRVNGV